MNVPVCDSAAVSKKQFGRWMSSLGLREETEESISLGAWGHIGIYLDRTVLSPFLKHSPGARVASVLVPSLW